jgi:hypothetical protein
MGMLTGWLTLPRSSATSVSSPASDVPIRPGWKLEAVEFREVGQDFALGAGRVVGHFDVAGYDVTPDGGFIRAERRKEPPSFTVVVNLARWLEDLERGASGGGRASP